MVGFGDDRVVWCFVVLVMLSLLGLVMLVLIGFGQSEFSSLLVCFCWGCVFMVVFGQ